MVNMGYYLTNLLFFDIPLLYYYIRYQIINNFLSFFWRYMSFFRCFSIFFISNCKSYFLWISWNFCNFICNCITNKITSCFYCFLNYSFWSSFKCICYILFSMIKIFLALFTTHIFTYTFLPKIFPIFLAKDKNP